jgi:hypothetical protein
LKGAVPLKKRFPFGGLKNLANFTAKPTTMYFGLLHTHSLLRFFILIALLVVLVQATIGVAQRKPFGKWQNKFSLYLLIFTHLQLLVGLVLYFVSPQVRFGPDTMSDGIMRYWTVEHIFGMLVAVTIITIGRVGLKRLSTDIAKHYRMLIFNGIALLIIVAVILMSGRPLLQMSTM